MESERKRNNVHIDDLPESLLLLEIFSKLHNLKDVIVCKSVSKSWNSILSSSSSSSSSSSAKSWAMILNTDPNRCVATNDTCLETWKGFKLRNYVDLKFKSPQVCVLASYRDVLLCIKHMNSPWSRSQTYLVNPVTMQWTRVPETTRQYLQYPIGLSGDMSKSRFYVVEMRKFPASMITFNVFDSEHCKWGERNVNHPPLPLFGWCPTQFQALNFNGALHWLAHDGPIVAYNPEFKHECRFIHRSQQMHHTSYGDLAVVSETLTVSMNHLRILQLVCYPPPDDHHHLVIWTLMDYKESIWKQENHEHPVYFKDMVSDRPWIQKYMRGYTLATTDQHSMSTVMKYFRYQANQESRIICPRPLHCHPDNPLLVYLYLPNGIVSLDVLTKKLRLITRLRYNDRNSRFWNQYDIVTPITLHLVSSLVPDHELVLLPRL